MGAHETYRKFISARREPELAEMLERLQVPVFPQQNAFILDPSTFVYADCTRRAGKSNGLGLRFYRTMFKHPGCLCPYVALTRESAQNIMWDILQEQAERFRIQAKFTTSKLTVTLKNGSRLKLFGADMKNFIRRLKGIKTPGAAVDEVQDFGAHLESLVEEVLEPTIADFTDGWLALCGTPPQVPVGYFYDVVKKGHGSYSGHHWSLFQNPFMPDPKGFVARLKAKKKWPDNHPTLLREWYGQWVLDLESLVFKYNPEKNHFQRLPKLDGPWQHIIGVDLGHDEADAIAVVAWHRKSKAAYLVDEFVQTGQGITELARELAKRIKRYDPMKVVIDTGGLGKKIAKEMGRRFELPVEAAEKDRKFEFIELLNDAMRMGQFFARKDSRFAADSACVKWDKKSVKLKISDDFHSDICDGVLYAYREALHWLYEPEQKKSKPGTDEWREEQRLEHEREAEERLRRQLETDEFGMPR